jgi:hypothetical protein
MTISVNPVYINNALSLKVYEVSDSAGFYQGQIAVTYDEETDVSPQECTQETHDSFAYIGPVHEASGLARTVTIVGYEMRTWADCEQDTLTPMKDALVLIVQDLFEE